MFEELRQTRENKLQLGRQTNKIHSSKEAPPHEEVEILLRQFLTTQKNTHRLPRGGMEVTPLQDIQIKQRPRPRKKIKTHIKLLKSYFIYSL